MAKFALLFRDLFTKFSISFCGPLTKLANFLRDWSSNFAIFCDHEERIFLSWLKFFLFLSKPFDELIIVYRHHLTHFAFFLSQPSDEFRDFSARPFKEFCVFPPEVIYFNRDYLTNFVYTSNTIWRLSGYLHLDNLTKFLIFSHDWFAESRDIFIRLIYETQYFGDSSFTKFIII